jgi:hypothetical protein|tara:strand:+ start:669 stop:860 length:192 start_codon:yes stop_codon:yes gene_type:complete
MNDLINDINLLKKIKAGIGVLHDEALKNFIQHHINEKQSVVEAFEKTAPMHIQELCETIKGGK